LKDHDESRDQAATSEPTDRPIPAEPFSSARLSFIPVLAKHAPLLFDTLRDESLYLHTGGTPPATVGEVKNWFEALESRSSPDGQQGWLTWIIYLTVERQPIGYLQATLDGDQADIAWLVGSEWQGNGFASESASRLVAWLVDYGVCGISARIRPGHAASCRVASAAGLVRSGYQEDGEDIWQLRPGDAHAP
jgi:RimJ/RimL family protein N-acetyltransferase